MKRSIRQDADRAFLLGTLALLILLSCSCCNPIRENSDPNKTFKASVQWTFNHPFSGSCLIAGDRAFVLLNEQYGMVAVDLATGTQKWRLDDVMNLFHGYPILIDGKIYIFEHYVKDNPRFDNYAIAVIDADGSHADRAEFEDGSWWAYSSASYGNSIYWTTGDSDHFTSPITTRYRGLAVLDVHTDIVSEGGILKAKPRLLWSIDEHDLIHDSNADTFGKHLRPYALTIDETGNIYTNLFENSKDYESSGTYTIKADKVSSTTGQVLWDTLLYRGDISPTPGADKCLVAGEGIAIIPNNFTAFGLDIDNGDIKFHTKTGYGANGRFFNGKLYAPSGSVDPNNVPTLQCINPKTGALIWGAMLKYSLGANPIVYRGVLYIAAPDALYCYDSETGEFLGKDESVHSRAPEILAGTYNDWIIFDDTTTLYAVKMDMHLRR